MTITTVTLAIAALSYDTVATFSQVTSLLMFIVMFATAVAYALWPSNGAKFDRWQRSALDLDAPDAKGIATNGTQSNGLKPNGKS